MCVEWNNWERKNILYRIISNDDRVSGKKFVFNAKTLNPRLTVAEAGLIENDHILVVETKGVRG